MMSTITKVLCFAVLCSAVIAEKKIAKFSLYQTTIKGASLYSSTEQNQSLSSNQTIVLPQTRFVLCTSDMALSNATKRSHCLSMYRYAVIQATVSKWSIRDTVLHVSTKSLLSGEPKVPIRPALREETALALKVFTCCADNKCTNITIGSTAALTKPFTQQSLQHNAVYQQAQRSLTMMCGQLSI